MFFFFQAEDGIRDHCVTGVQTCALPISWRRAATRAAIDVRLAGESAETEGIVKGTVAAATPTVLLIDDSQLLTAAGAGEQITALWSSHPLLITLAQVALRNLA